MEEFDIENLNFDEYNRSIYLEKKPQQHKESRLFNSSHADDAQKRYKSEIDKFVTEYKRGLAKNELDETALGRIKKRKL